MDARAENLWEPYSSAMLVEVQAELDEGKQLRDWKYELWSTPHNERIVNAGRLLPAWLLAKPFTPAPSVPIAQPEGTATVMPFRCMRSPTSRSI